jgi:hypothetical protein
MAVRHSGVCNVRGPITEQAKEQERGATPSGEHDIDVVIVTGAGASREFGINWTTLPLMGDWCDELVSKLQLHPPYLTATGLRRGMLGEEFEAQLGKFLRQVEAFGLIKDLLGPSVDFQDLGPALQTVRGTGVLENQWHAPTTMHLRSIVNKIRESLYEQFAEKTVDFIRANDAYRALFQLLDLGPGQRLVYATTNYDTIAEAALKEYGRLPDWGQPPGEMNAAEASLVVDGLIDGLPRYTPVLHLHGRVGWYRREGGRVCSMAVVRHQEGLGIPIVMLPDPDKVYDADDVINSLWDQFQRALRRAKRVFVLGHSLNDRFLLRALTENVQPFDRIAVSVLSDGAGPGGLSEFALPVIDKVRIHFGEAVAIIPMVFGGRGATGAEAIAEWTDRLGRGGLLSG